MKDYLKNAQQVEEELKKLAEGKEVRKEILIITLEGEVALQYRLLLGLCREGKEQQLVKEIIESGLDEITKLLGIEMLDSIKKRIKDEFLDTEK